jgi:hypothetical protein
MVIDAIGTPIPALPRVFEGEILLTPPRFHTASTHSRPWDGLLPGCLVKQSRAIGMGGLLIELYQDIRTTLVYRRSYHQRVQHRC